MIGYWWRHKKNTNSMRMVEWIENQNQNFLWMAEIVRSDKYNLLLSLSSFVIILNAFFVSCSKMPHAPTYDGHFDRLTVTRTNWNKISQTQLFFQERKLSSYHKQSKQTFRIMNFKTLCNRPFATNGHMVQNPPYWRASSLLFLHWGVKTKRPQPVNLEWPLF